MTKYKLFLILFFHFTLSAKELEISNAKIRIVPPSAPATALYFDIKNNSNENITIVAIKSDDFKNIEMHEMKTENNMMTMRKIDTLRVNPNSTLKFEKGSYHGMIFDLKTQIQINKKYKIYLLDSKKNQHHFTATGTDFI